MKRFRPILSFYLAKHYAGAIIGLLLGIAALMALFDAIESLRIVGKAGSMDLRMVAYLSMLKVPGNILMIAPFIVLFSAMWTLSVLSRRQEFVVMRMSGASLWQLLTPLFVVAFLYGAILVAIVNPLAAATEREYRNFEEQVLNREQHMVSLLHKGLWLRQSAQNETNGNDKTGPYFILHAARVKVPDWALGDVIVLFFNGQNQLQSRIDAPTARLQDGSWIFDSATKTSARGTEDLTNYHLPTTLTRANLEESFLTPETISVWQMPRFIRMMESTGFQILPLQVHFGGLLALPFLTAALVMIAAVVSTRPSNRQGGQGQLIIIGVISGFAVFFMNNFLQALGASGQIPVWLAAMAPAALTIAVGSVAILTIEDQ